MIFSLTYIKNLF